jgi:hypothetical protein
MINQPLEALQAPPEALAESLQRLRAEFGSVTGYLESCGVSADQVRRTRDNLLEAG